jgi:hypothetical protein
MAVEHDDLIAIKRANPCQKSTKQVQDLHIVQKIDGIAGRQQVIHGGCRQKPKLMSDFGRLDLNVGAPQVMEHAVGFRRKPTQEESGAALILKIEVDDKGAREMAANPSKVG